MNNKEAVVSVVWECAKCFKRYTLKVGSNVPESYWYSQMKRFCVESAVKDGLVECDHLFVVQRVSKEPSMKAYVIKDNVVAIRKDMISTVNVNTVFEAEHLSGHIVETLNSDMVVLEMGAPAVACHRYRVQIVQLNEAEIKKMKDEKEAAEKKAAEDKIAADKLTAENAAKNANEAPPPLPASVTATLPDNSQALKEVGAPMSGAVKGGLAAKIAAQNPTKK